MYGRVNKCILEVENPYRVMKMKYSVVRDIYETIEIHYEVHYKTYKLQ